MRTCTTDRGVLLLLASAAIAASADYYLKIDAVGARNAATARSI